jgi:acyl-CoA thioesterase I
MRRPLRRYGASRRVFNLALVAGFLAACLVASASEAAEKRLLLLGDSLTAGYGLPPEDGFAQQLQRALDARGAEVTVIDAGVSGDTSAGGLARLQWSLGDKPTHALVELGANDALRGLPPEAMEKNLDEIITTLQEAGVAVMLAGMIAPRNLGSEYRAEFEGAFPRLAKKHSIQLYPFFLDGLMGKKELIQPDGLHPNAAGVAVIVERILPSIESLLAQGDAS